MISSSTSSSPDASLNAPHILLMVSGEANSLLRLGFVGALALEVSEALFFNNLLCFSRKVKGFFSLPPSHDTLSEFEEDEVDRGWEVCLFHRCTNS